MIYVSDDMWWCSTSASTEAQDLNQQNVTRASQQDSMPHEGGDEDNQKRDGNGDDDVNEEEQDEDDDEDVDFSPFLKESNILGDSSSLSSEVEDFDTDVGKKPFASSVKSPMGKGKDISENANRRGTIVSQMAICAEEVLASGPQITAVSDTEVILNAQSETGLLCDKDNGLNIITSVNNTTESKPSADVDSEGAICMRTRARYSLASFTLDELETFLQETDDDDHLHNVDDESEYRKFLASVMRGDDSQNLHENANADDEDDENDADFELELEETLECEVDEIEERRKSQRNRCQNKYVEHDNQLSIQRPLRPLLPSASSRSNSSFDGKNLAPNAAQLDMIHAGSGFTPHQIGQLHCLIHEHVQLLVQVFSVCVVDNSKKHIAVEVKKIILEMLQKREQALACRTLSYPSICFFPPYVQPSVRDDLRKILQPNGTNQNVQGDAHFKSDRGLQSVTSPSQNLQCPVWVPYICGPVLSVMDVAPLRLVGNYIDEVSSFVEALQNYGTEHGFDTPCRNEPLFPLHYSACSTESDGQRHVENMPSGVVGAVSSSSTNQTPKIKKTMAATLLEKAKRQPVTFVPKEIAELAQRFWPLFNPTLYPHKPPPAPLARRVLFTDAEDELLALGLMEYNTDWKAIQQRFLPCKSRHQIFVRQKNCKSAKAPENPTKAVGRMKKSPLTTKEMARIEMGLKMYNKPDWISIWRFFVPYRDPLLLPRQWRDSCRIQKSYKSDATKKRVCELRRKASKQLSSVSRSSFEKKGDDISGNPVEETNCWDNHIDMEYGTYVHEAFLADCNPENDTLCPTNPSSQESCHNREQVDYSAPVGVETPWVSQSSSQRLFNSQVVLRPYRARRQSTSRLVKLAPNLPPINLPPSVRVMSQAAFRNSLGEASKRVSGNINATSTAKDGTHHCIKYGQPRTNAVKGNDVNQHREHSYVSKKCAVDRGYADLQMHPLLFQSPQEGHLPYSPLTCDSSTSGSFTLFSGKQPQLTLSLSHNPPHIKNDVNFFSNSSKLPDKDASSSSGDFHPLLRRTDEVGESIMGTKLHCLSDKIDELDLDIHLNFTPKNQVALRDTPSLETENDTGSDKMKDSASEARKNVMVACRINEREEIADMHDDSLPGIVMEQEELSDSDEEFEENVEFECEEMIDSEGDSESDSEQFVNAGNEEVCPHETVTAIDCCHVPSNREGITHQLAVSYFPVSPHSDTSNVKPRHESRPFSTSNLEESTKQGNGRTRKRAKDVSQCLNLGSSETLPANSRKRSCK